MAANSTYLPSKQEVGRLLSLRSEVRLKVKGPQPFGSESKQTDAFSVITSFFRNH